MGFILHTKNIQNVCCVMVYYVFLCPSVRWFFTVHFVMVPLNLTYQHCLQHSFFEHLFNLYCEFRKYDYVNKRVFCKEMIDVCFFTLKKSEHVLNMFDI